MRIEASKLLRPAIGIKVGRPTFHKAWSFKHCFQLTGKSAWAAEVKYDGEYCEIHIDLEKERDLLIFSKNGKDATQDRKGLHATIRKALRIGQPGCMFKRNCIVLGEMVPWSDKAEKILPFSKLRKQIQRSGSFMGNLQDSLPHEWEHLMIVFFDVLVLDDEPIMRQGYQERRDMLRKMVEPEPGRAMRSVWWLLDFKVPEHGMMDLKDAFAKSLAAKEEGLVLKPLHAPYFPLLPDLGKGHRGYFIKLKKDYLDDIGDERDLGDFALVGASKNPQVAAKFDRRSLHWTHFHVGCLLNKPAVVRLNAKPKFKIVCALSMDKCIPRVDAKYLNTRGRLYESPLGKDGNSHLFDFEHSLGYGPRMTVAFKKPFVVEIMGGGYEQAQNETFQMLRHPRVKKIHSDRTWENSLTMEELEQKANEKWVPDVDKLDGHARDVALLARKYVAENDSQINAVISLDDTQETTPCTTQRTSQPTPRPQRTAVEEDDATVPETQDIDSQPTWKTNTTSQCSIGSTQEKGICASREFWSFLIREDTSERINLIDRPRLQLLHRQAGSGPPLSSAPAPRISATPSTSTATKRRSFEAIVTPPRPKRRRVHTPLKDAGSKGNMGNFKTHTQEDDYEDTQKRYGV